MRTDRNPRTEPDGSPNVGYSMGGMAGAAVDMVRSPGNCRYAGLSSTSAEQAEPFHCSGLDGSIPGRSMTVFRQSHRTGSLFPRPAGRGLHTMSTFIANQSTVTPKWVVIDATDLVVGR